MLAKVDVPINTVRVKQYITHEEKNHDSPQMFFLAVMDCDDEIHKTVGTDPLGKVKVVADITDGVNEFSYEDQGVLMIDQVLFTIYSILFLIYIWDYFKKGSQFTNIHQPHSYVILAMAQQMIGITFSLIHNTAYAKDGEGYELLDVFSQANDIFSETTMSILILMLANGWYTVWHTYDSDDFDQYGLQITLLFVMQFSNSSFTFIDRDAYHKYHDFGGNCGITILITKAILLGCFFYFHSWTYPQLNKHQKDFYHHFLPIGILYLTSDAILMSLSHLFAEWNRQFFYRITDQSLHIFLMLWFYQEVSSHHSLLTKSLHKFNSLP